ncbi:hypothetical protein AMTRI_Chr03g43570 [Amborella trichopoda]|uniref:Rab escort protein 1 n=1 Tax=Amborella trichopoda TaxID=13333 RepID=W1PUB9_AMBTC|nr:rab escort protein 1 [Amborella trichopoda]ERN11429.1 hypothetical protein AMTR_s00022p00049680 [Amborella trichopoda]|eukprot:XP_006849848.1 rab escort protein 1 [Amborella trichopoda]
MEEPPYHPIEPCNFDLILSNTGFPLSIIAAAASIAGKSVLHLDPSPLYGSHYSSLPLDSFISFSQNSNPNPSPYSSPDMPDEEADYRALTVEYRPLFSAFELSTHSSDHLGPSRSFNLDLSGPRVYLSRDSTVDLLLRSGANNYLEFKGMEATFIWYEDGLFMVPESRNAVFRDQKLGFLEKRHLTGFFKLIREGGFDEREMEGSFVEFLEKKGISPLIKSIILYAIALADYDQEKPKDHNNLLSTRDGVESSSLYLSSVGRFPNAPGAFIYPMYGQGELPQAFCRCAAVKGAIYVLRMPVIALLIDKETGHYKGIRVSSGQDLFSHKLVLDPSIAVPPKVFSPTELHNKEFEGLSLDNAIKTPKLSKYVARGVFLTRTSQKPGLSTLLVVFPPRSLYPEQMATVRALQLGSNASVCPNGMFVVYISTPCDDAAKGKEVLRAAMNVLFMIPDAISSENLTPTSEGVQREGKPVLLWSALYIQEMIEGSSNPVYYCPTPDEKLDYRGILNSATKLFHEMYPSEDFFSQAAAMESSVENDINSLD